ALAFEGRDSEGEPLGFCASDRMSESCRKLFVRHCCREHSPVGAGASANVFDAVKAKMENSAVCLSSTNMLNRTKTIMERRNQFASWRRCVSARQTHAGSTTHLKFGPGLIRSATTMQPRPKRHSMKGWLE